MTVWDFVKRAGVSGRRFLPGAVRIEGQLLAPFWPSPPVALPRAGEGGVRSWQTDVA